MALQPECGLGGLVRCF